MSYSYYGDFETFMHDDGDGRIFRMLVYKKIFTPLEQEKKYIDQGVYTDICYQDVVVKEVIPLGDNSEDLLIGFQYLYDYDDYGADEYDVHYHKLSDIELLYSPLNEKEYRDEEE